MIEYEDLPHLNERVDILHDAALTSINSQNKLVVLSGITEMGKTWDLKLFGVQFFACAPFLSKNIIGSVLVRKWGFGVNGNVIASKELEKVLDMYGPSFKRVNSSRQFIIEMSTSYGAELLCIFDGELTLEIGVTEITATLA